MAFPDDLVATRRALHAVAEHVLAPALHRATGHIGLRRSDGGFATPPYPDGGLESAVGVSGRELVIRRAEIERCSPLTTLRAAADLVGIEPGAPADVYSPVTPLRPDQPLLIGADAASVVAELFEISDEALARFAAAHPGEEKPVAQLWPEHFDLALTADEVNFGGSPGDAEHDAPYFYVGPWTTRVGSFWNEPFGASLTFRDGMDVDEVVDFFELGRERVGLDPTA